MDNPVQPSIWWPDIATIFRLDWSLPTVYPPASPTRPPVSPTQWDTHCPCQTHTARVRHTLPMSDTHCPHQTHCPSQTHTAHGRHVRDTLPTGGMKYTLSTWDTLPMWDTHCPRQTHTAHVRHTLPTRDMWDTHCPCETHTVHVRHTLSTWNTHCPRESHTAYVRHARHTLSTWDRPTNPRTCSAALYKKQGHSTGPKEPRVQKSSGTPRGTWCRQPRVSTPPSYRSKVSKRGA